MSLKLYIYLCVLHSMFGCCDVHCLLYRKSQFLNKHKNLTGFVPLLKRTLVLLSGCVLQSFMSNTQLVSFICLNSVCLDKSYDLSSTWMTSISVEG